MRTSCMTGTTDDHHDVLVALTLHRSSRMRRIYAPVPDSHPGGPGFLINSISLDGMAELQNDRECDQCRRLLPTGTAVLGKNVSYTDYSISGSFFAATCIECFAKDRGGLYSAAIAGLVMET